MFNNCLSNSSDCNLRNSYSIMHGFFVAFYLKNDKYGTSCVKVLDRDKLTKTDRI